MEKELVTIVLQKSFIELSENERIELMEWCSSEEEYDQMKQVFLEVESMKKSQTETVRPETKKSLDALFMEKHRKSPVMWNHSVMTVMYPVEKPFHRRPLVQVAALALLLLLTYPMLQHPAGNPANQLAENESPAQKIKEQKAETTMKDPASPGNNTQTKQPLMASATQPESTINFSQPVASMAANDLVDDVSINMASIGFVHPDGVFVGDNNTAIYSQPVSEEPEMLDLLTVAF